MNRGFRFVPLVWICLLGGLVAGCQAEPVPETPQVSELNLSRDLSFIANSQKLVAVLDGLNLIVADPETNTVGLVDQLPSDQLLTQQDFGDLKVSANKQFIVWYAPQSGLISYNLESKSSQVVHPKSDWLDTHPYFDFFGDSDQVLLIDNQGRSLHRYELSTNQSSVVDIPFPYGTVFKISPDLSRILYISGFSIEATDSEFMITNSDGSNPVRFDTQTPIPLRSQTVWMPDSSGVLVLNQDQTGFDLIDLEGDIRENYFINNKGGIITEVYRRQEKIFFATSENRWHAIDPINRVEVGRAPLEIARDLRRPKFIPWYDNSFLMIETISYNNQQFQRLWHSSFTGVKDLVIEQYNTVNLETDIPEL